MALPCVGSVDPSLFGTTVRLSGSVCTLSIMEAYRKRGVISIRFRMRGSRAFSKPWGKRYAGVAEGAGWRSIGSIAVSHSGGGDVINDFLNKRSVCKLSVQRSSLGNDCSPGGGRMEEERLEGLNENLPGKRKHRSGGWSRSRKTKTGETKLAQKLLFESVPF